MIKEIKRLIDFQNVFNRDDFSFVCNNYSVLKKAISEFYFYDEKRKKEVVFFIEEYENAIISFLNWSYKINSKEISILKNKFIKLFDLMKATTVESNQFSHKQIKKLMKDIKHLLIKDFYNFLNIMFYYAVISQTNLSKEQIIKFILNDRLELGKHYVYNTANIPYSFVRHLNDLEKSELYEVVKHLAVKDIRKDAKREIMGKGSNNHLRIHIKRKRGLLKGKIWLYLIFRNPSEKRIHEQEIKMPIETIQFVPL